VQASDAGIDKLAGESEFSHGLMWTAQRGAMSFSGCDNKVLQLRLILLPIAFLCLVEAGRFFVPA
jgi:hypothetical protein